MCFKSWEEFLQRILAISEPVQVSHCGSSSLSLSYFSFRLSGIYVCPSVFLLACLRMMFKVEFNFFGPRGSLAAIAMPSYIAATEEQQFGMNIIAASQLYSVATIASRAMGKVVFFYFSFSLYLAGPYSSTNKRAHRHTYTDNCNCDAHTFVREEKWTEFCRHVRPKCKNLLYKYLTWENSLFCQFCFIIKL